MIHPFCSLSFFFFFFLGKNIFLDLIFWGYIYVGSYILIKINLVPIIFNVQLIWL